MYLLSPGKQKSLQGTGFILFLFSHDKFVKEGTNERKIVVHV